MRLALGVVTFILLGTGFLAAMAGEWWSVSAAGIVAALLIYGVVTA